METIFKVTKDHNFAKIKAFLQKLKIIFKAEVKKKILQNAEFLKKLIESRKAEFFQYTDEIKSELFKKRFTK